MSQENESVDFRALIREHVNLYLEHPDQGHHWDSTPYGGPGILPCLLLTTKGRRSGKIRRVPLIYGRAGQDFVIVASKGGDPRHPVWYLNLKAEPECKIRVGRDRYYATARTASAEEREGLWEMMAALYPPYNDYQAAAQNRQIPVVVLEVGRTETESQ